MGQCKKKLSISHSLSEMHTIVDMCWINRYHYLSGKKLKSVFDFLTYSRETGFSFSYEEVVAFIGLIEAFNEIDRVSKLDNSISFGAKQNAL